MSSLNYSFNSSILSPILCDHFGSLLALGIHCLQYFYLIKSSSRFKYASNIFHLTARISVSTYIEESYVRIECPRTQFEFSIFWFHGYISENGVKVEEIFPENSTYFSSEVIDGNHYLIIYSAYLWLDGSYTCMSRMGDFYIDYTVRIYITELPQFAYFDRRVFGSENETIAIKCSVKAPREHELNINNKYLYGPHWERHNKILMSSEKYSMTQYHDDYYLKITNLKKEDEGWYYCVLSNYPRRRKRIVLYIKELPKIEEEFEIKAVFQGQDAIFHCPTESRKYTLLKRMIGPQHAEITLNYVLGDDSRGTNFQLDYASPGHDGIYFCKLSASIPEIYILLIVIEKPPVLLTRDQEISAYQGTTVHLECKSTFRSLQEIVWTVEETGKLIAYGSDLQNQYVNNFVLLTDENSSILSIVSVDFKHTSTYKCRLNEQRAKLRLYVKAVPRLLGCNYRRMLHLEEDARFECRHESALDINLTWFKNGVNIDPNHRKYTAENGEFLSTLIVHNVDLSDSGNYTQCFDVYNNNCSDYESYGLYFIPSISLNVVGKRNKLNYDNKFEIITEGDSYEMVCSVHRLLPEEKLCWSFPDGSVHECYEKYILNEDYLIHSTGSECNISIGKIIGDKSSRTQSGTYTCQLNCSTEENHFIVSYHLKVTSGPRFSHEIKFLTAFLGYEYRMACSVSNPDDREVMLLKKTNYGYETVLVETMRKGESFQLNYWFGTTEQYDEGEYVCKFSPSDRYGFELDEMKINLTVLSEPIISIKTTGKLIYGGRVVFECEVSGMENYTGIYEIEWLKGDFENTELIAKGLNLIQGFYYYELSTEVHKSLLVVKHLFNRDCRSFICRITTSPKFFKLIFPQCEQIDTENQEDIFGIKGRNVELNCRILSSKENPIWFVEKHNYTVSIQVMIDVALDHVIPSKYEISQEHINSRLLIIDVDMADTAKYICLYPSFKMINYYVEIVEEPRINVTDVIAHVNGRASISCNVTNIKSLEVIWVHEQKRLTGRENRHALIKFINSETINITLIISPVELTDQGAYKCIIVGSNPGLQKTARLTVLN